MTLLYAQEARDRIRSLPPEIKRGVRQALESLQENPSMGKPLQRELTGFWSLSYKRHRIIYKPLADQKTIRIYTLGERKRIYQDFAEFLRSRPEGALK